MNQRILKLIGITITLSIAISVIFIRKTDDCSLFSDTFDELKTVVINNKNYYLYRSISGFQDKVIFFSLSSKEIKTHDCDHKEIAKHTYISAIEEDKIIKKLTISHDSQQGLILEVVYSGQGEQSVSPEALARVPVEVDGKLQPPPR